MKKQLLLLILLVCFYGLSAQVTAKNDSVHEEYNVSESDPVVHNFHSTTNAPTRVKWMVHNIVVPSSWTEDVIVCDAEQCKPATVDSASYQLLDNKEASLDIHFINNDNVGEGYAELLLWEVGDSLNTVQIVKYTVKIDQGINIKDVQDLKISVFPNPTRNILNLTNINTAEIQKIELFNVIGKKLVSLENPSSKELVNLDAYSNGVYVLKITDTNNYSYSQNIIKK